MPGPPLRDLSPFRLIVGSEDLSFLLADSFTFSSRDPGGFESASFSVPKDLPQTLRGTYVRLDSGLHVAWEGRVKQIQRSLGSHTQIQCEGDGALLADDEASMVFIDRDLTRWAPWSVTRQAALATAGYNIGQFNFQVGADTANLLPAQVVSAAGQLIGSTVIGEAWYDAGPLNLIARVRINSGAAIAYTFPDTNNVLRLFASSDDKASTTDNDSNIAGATPSRDWTLPTKRRYTVIQHTYAPPGGAAALNAGTTYGYSLSNLSVIGSHGLTLRGAAPNDGFYPSDIAGWIISQAPGLQQGVIVATDQTAFILPHSVYYTPISLDSMMSDMSVAAGWHWGVWESLAPLTGNPAPRCDFRPRPALGRFTAFCLRRDTALCDVREDLSEQYNACVVNYTDPAGVQQAVSVTVDNPILDQAGISSRTLILSAGTMTSATAALYGAEALALTYATARVAGSVQIDQAIDGPNGPGPAWLLKPGIDRLRIGDLPSFDAWGAYNDLPLQRMEFSGSSSGLSVSLEVGQGASLVETLNARLASATFLAGQGG